MSIRHHQNSSILKGKRSQTALRSSSSSSSAAATAAATAAAIATTHASHKKSPVKTANIYNRVEKPEHSIQVFTAATLGH